LKPNLLPILGAVLSIFFWIIDSIIDVLLFGEEESILESLFSPELVELWMRTIVIFLLITFSFYARYLLKLQINASNELIKHKNQLEETVDLRTTELQSKNIELQNEIKIRIKAEETLEEIAITDPLTLLYNRRKFNEILKYEIERERRYKSGLLLILCDIDNFKKINDKYGHNTGDEILKTFSQVMKNSIRKSDSIARWGGEEFILLISNADSDKAIFIAEKLRKTIEETEFKPVNSVTASFGATFFEGNDSEESLIARADKALYRAKDKGRNLVEVYNSGNTNSGV